MVPVRIWWTPKFSGHSTFERPFDHLEIDTNYPIEPKVDAQFSISDFDETGQLPDNFDFVITDVMETYWAEPHDFIRIVINVDLYVDSELPPEESSELEIRVANLLKSFYNWKEEK